MTSHECVAVNRLLARPDCACTKSYEYRDLTELSVCAHSAMRARKHGVHACSASQTLSHGRSVSTLDAFESARPGDAEALAARNPVSCMQDGGRRGPRASQPRREARVGEQGCGAALLWASGSQDSQQGLASGITCMRNLGDDLPRASRAQAAQRRRTERHHSVSLGGAAGGCRCRGHRHQKQD